MQNYIDGIQSQTKSGKLQLENYTSGTLSEYQLDSWLKDEVGSTCSRVETEEVDRIEELQKKLAKASTPSEYLKIAKEIGIENLNDDQKQIVTMLETVEGISKGLLKAGKDFVKGIFDFVTHPVKTIESTMDAIAHPIETYDYLSKFIADSFQRDVINGDAKSRAEWISYALGTLGLSVVGTKGLGAVTKTGMTTVKATAKVGVRKVKGAAKKIPTLNLYPYAPQHQLVGVNAGVVPYNTVNSVGLRDQLISMAKVEARRNGKDTGKSKGVNENNLRNIDDFINGNKKFDEVIEDYAEVYKEHVNFNKPWSWDDTIPGGDSLSSAQKRKIKEMAIEKGHIPEIKVSKVDGMRYGFADFSSVGVVEETIQLPERFWKLSDKEQFKWLDEQIGGTRKGTTWHHTEVPGKMELVPFGIHNITPHNGGRTKGMWADAPR